jgi:hypothetical protein
MGSVKKTRFLKANYFYVCSSYVSVHKRPSLRRGNTKLYTKEGNIKKKETSVLKIRIKIYSKGNVSGCAFSGVFHIKGYEILMHLNINITFCTALVRESFSGCYISTSNFVSLRDVRSCVDITCK